MGFPATGNISLSPKVGLWDKKKTGQEMKLKFMLFLCIFSHLSWGGTRYLVSINSLIYHILFIFTVNSLLNTYCRS